MSVTLIDQNEWHRPKECTRNTRKQTVSTADVCVYIYQLDRLFCLIVACCFVWLLLWLILWLILCMDTKISTSSYVYMLLHYVVDPMVSHNHSEIDKISASKNGCKLTLDLWVLPVACFSLWQRNSTGPLVARSVYAQARSWSCIHTYIYIGKFYGSLWKIQRSFNLEIDWILFELYLV